MAQAAKSQEPSMEEILASIRRIIAEDDSDKLAQPAAEAAGAEVNSDVAPASVEAGLEARLGTGLGTPRAIGESHSLPPEPPAPTRNVLSATKKAPRTSTVLDLTEPMTSSASRSAAPAIEPNPAPVPPAPIGEAAAKEAESTAQSSGTHDGQRGELMSTATSAAVDSAFNALAQTVLVHNARTLEDLVREMLRPMLKVWLDDNLPGMVERLVRAEIERVSRGRAG